MPARVLPFQIDTLEPSADEVRQLTEAYAVLMPYLRAFVLAMLQEAVTLQGRIFDGK